MKSKLNCEHIKCKNSVTFNTLFGICKFEPIQIDHYQKIFVGLYENALAISTKLTNGDRCL